MAEDKDRLQRAADALDALGGGQSQSEPSGEPQEPAPAAPARASSEPVAGRPPAVRVVVKRQGGSSTPGQDAAARAGSSSRRLMFPEQMQRERTVQFRRTAIPILLSTGIAMILLGLWSASVLLLGTVPFSDAEVTAWETWLARLALLAWPIAAVLLAGTAFFMHDVYRWYKAQEQTSGQE